MKLSPHQRDDLLRIFEAEGKIIQADTVRVTRDLLLAEDLALCTNCRPKINYFLAHLESGLRQAGGGS